MMKHAEIDEVHVRVRMNLPGPYPEYFSDQFPMSPSLDCVVICSAPTNIVFTLDEESVASGWHFAGYAPRPSYPMPLYTNLGFSSAFPNLSVTVFNPATRPKDIHYFSLMYSNPNINGGIPFSFDPETQNDGTGV